jgi:micrococcal nuclease
MYEYRGKVISCHDGDTWLVNIDLGFDITVTHHIRLLGIDTPEVAKVRGADEKEVARGKEITAEVRKMVEGQEVLLQTVKDSTDKYGRYLADVYLNGVWVNQYMRNEGYDKHS